MIQCANDYIKGDRNILGKRRMGVNGVSLPHPPSLNPLFMVELSYL